MSRYFNSIQFLLFTSASSLAAALYIFAPIFERIGLRGWFTQLKSHKTDEIKINTKQGPLFISNEERLRHTHIVGATGSGKTVLMEALIKADIERGSGLLIIDAKGDRELFEQVKCFAKAVGRLADVKLLSATHTEESTTWNPCRHGDAGQVQSKIFLSGVYDNPFYEKACEGLLLKACNKLVEVKKPFTLTDVLEELKNLPIKNEHKEHALGLIYDIENFLDGAYGGILLAKPFLGKKEEITLFDIVRKNEILFIDLPTESRELESKRFGKMILQELKFLSGLRKTHPKMFSEKDAPFSVYIDEFDAFASESFITFLNKGRSSRFMIHLAHQTLSDLEKVSPHFEKQLSGNINTRFVFRQDNPDDAEKWSKLFGTEISRKITRQTINGEHSGTGSVRDTQEFRIHPDTIKELKIGECIFSSKASKRSSLKKIQIKLPKDEKPVLSICPRDPISHGESVRTDSKVKSLSNKDPFEFFNKKGSSS